jgi:predicted phosphoribosyltransferase
VVVNQPTVRRVGLSDAWVAEAVTQGISAVNRRARAYRGGRVRRDLRGQRVIVVDDSVATGVTMQAAVTAVRALGAREVILAVPVLPVPAADLLRPQVDRIVSLATPAELVACDLHYPSPHAVSDDDIRRFLQQAAASPPRSAKDGVGNLRNHRDG